MEKGKLLNFFKKHNEIVLIVFTLAFAFRIRLWLFANTIDFHGISNGKVIIVQLMLENARRGFWQLGELVLEAYRAGIPLAIGSDIDQPGHAVLEEMLLFNRIGIPMEDVLRSATIVGARVIDRENLYGSIEPGKRANLLIFEQNPLADAENLYTGKIVVKDGKIWRQ